MGMYFIAKTAKHLSGDHAAVIAPVVYALTYIGLGIWNIGQRDAFIVPFLAYAVWLLVQDKLSMGKLVALGLSSGYMILLRPMFILFALFAAAYSWSREKQLKSGLTILVFGALPALLVIFTYLAIGKFDILYESIVQFNLEVYGKFRHGVSMRGSGTMTLIYIWGLVGLFYLAVKDKASLRPMIPVLVATLIAPLSTFIQGQGDAHHMTPSYAMAAIWCGVGIAAVIEAFKPGSEKRRIIGLVIAVLLIVLRGSDRLPWDSMNAYASGESLRSIYEMSRSTDVKLVEEFAVADYLKPQLSKGDQLFIWSMRIWPYQLTGHGAPTRFQTHEHILMQPKGQPLRDLQLKWRAEMIRELQAKPPKFILWTTTDNLWLLPNAESSKDQIKRFPEFEQFVRDRYSLDTAIGGFEVLKRN
jgi:4-amino-4-deoxy-L-arabinose transferase-like glycosyltransferase